MTKLEKIAKECFEKQINPEESEFECFFHYTDEKLFEAGFKKGYEHAIQSQWVDYDFNVMESRPPKYGRYFVMRKDGKVHWEVWNGNGWAYNNESIVAWMKILEYKPKEN